MPWPGIAATNVSLFSIAKNRNIQTKYIGNKTCENINPQLDEGGDFRLPYSLIQSGKYK